MKILTDFHHGSLLRSLVMLFEGRLGMELYRPIGLEWLHRGYWAINDLPGTAKSYLSVESEVSCGDGTSCVPDPGGRTTHRACTLEYLMSQRFDYVMASLPAHVPLFQDLVAKYQPQARLIVHLGNNWNVADYAGHNVLASIAPQRAPGVNVFFYHQEFELDIFAPAACLPSRKIYAYVNLLQHYPTAWQDFQRLKERLAADGYEVKAYGGLCPDGNKSGPVALAASMRDAQFVFHVKPGGDGFGHVIHNAYAIGRPVITRPSHYRRQLAEALLVPGTFIDLDRHGRNVDRIIRRLTERPEHLREMGKQTAARFREVVNYDVEARALANWLDRLP